MKIYRIEMMDGNSYGNYLGGGYNYRVTYYDVEAEDEKQALAIAKKDNPSYFVNENWVRETNERKHTINEKDRIIARIAELEKNLAQAKADLKKFEQGLTKPLLPGQMIRVDAWKLNSAN